MMIARRITATMRDDIRSMFKVRGDRAMRVRFSVDSDLWAGLTPRNTCAVKCLAPHITLAIVANPMSYIIATAVTTNTVVVM